MGKWTRHGLIAGTASLAAWFVPFAYGDDQPKSIAGLFAPLVKPSEPRKMTGAVPKLEIPVQPVSAESSSNVRYRTIIETELRPVTRTIYVEEPRVSTRIVTETKFQEIHET